jgi:two-component sensor histidine kinase/PAS domain-containing protein
MTITLDAITILSVVLSVTISIISMFVYYENRNRLSLFLCIGFFLFAVSFFIPVYYGTSDLDPLTLIIRMLAFLTVLFALFFYLGEIRSQVSTLSWKNRQLESEILDRNRAEEAMMVSEHRLSYIINFLPDATFAIDLNGNVIAWNKAIEEMTGVPADQVIGKGEYEYAIPFYGTRRPVLIDLVSDDEREIEKRYPGVVKKGDKLISETFVPLLYGGTGAYLWLIASPLYDARGILVGAVESIRDITDRKIAEDNVRHTLEEKDVLLQEIHHRVKNNLQVVSALIELQIQYMKDRNSINTLRDSQNRIRTMALIHETLYRSHDLSKVEFQIYIKKLVDALFDTYSIDESTIKTIFEVDSVLLDVDTAIHCGLIVNELVSNSFKHAFPDRRTGTITIGFHQLGSDYTLSYADNGVGIPEGIDFNNTESLGLKLVSLLSTEQLDGTIQLIRGEGTKYCIVFPGKPGY